MQRLRPAAIKGVILSAVIGILVAAAFSNQYLEAREMLLKTAWGRLWLVVCAIFLVVNIAALIWRVVLFLRYSPVSGCCDEELPACTVIVPAFNEGRQVLLTLESLARSDYPGEKLQLIAVDDGSVDDTWHWIEQAKASLGRHIDHDPPAGQPGETSCAVRGDFKKPRRGPGHGGQRFDR